MNAEIEGIERQFKHSLCMLAADGETALSSLPEACVRSDELALDFDSRARAYASSFRDSLTQLQVHAISRIDGLLESMSDGSMPDVWTDAAVLIDAKWREVRTAARLAVDSLGWDCSANQTMQTEGRCAAVADRPDRYSDGG